MDPYLNQNQGQATPFIMAPEAEEAPSFDFWGVLNRRKWLVFLGLVCGLALATLVYAKSSDVFESIAYVKIEPKQRFTPVGNGKPMFPEHEEGVRHDRFMNQENIINKMFDENPSLEGLECFFPFPSREDKIEYIVESLSIGQDSEEPTLYKVSYQNSHAAEAPAILNALIETYKLNLVEQYADEKSEIVENLHRFDQEYTAKFEKAYTDYDRLVQEKIEKNLMMSSNASQSQMLLHSLMEKSGLAQEELSTLSNDRERITTALESGEGAVRQIVWQLRSEDKMPHEFRPNGTRSRLIEGLQLRISEAEDQYMLAKDRFGNGHRTVELAKARLARLQEDLDDTVYSQEDFTDAPRPLTDQEALDSYYKLINSQISTLQTALSSNLKQQAIHAAKSQELQKLEQKIAVQQDKTESIQELLEEITKRFAEITPLQEDEANDEGYRVQFTQLASEGDKVWPILPLILGVGGLLGSMCGFGLGCLVELADKTFHNPDEIMKHMHMPLIGHIPVITGGKSFLVEGSVIDPTICTYHRPKSQTSEAFRAVRTALYFNTQGKQHSVIQVTSPTPGDGKSTLAANLAVSIAQSGKRVLLVDADMRRPRQHVVFGIEATEGFATVLSGASAWRDCLYECEEIEGLTLMPCGKKPQNPAELCSSPQVKELIGELREEFDFVIIDTPPMLAVTDAGPIAARVDGVILTLRIKKNVRVSAERASDMLRNIGANCIGLVVNGVGAQSGYGSQYTYGAYRAGYSYNGYGYGYGYGQGYGVGKYYEEDKKGRKVAPRAIESETHQEI